MAALILLLLIPFASAAEDECGITNLASCLPEIIYNFVLDIINSPIAPFLAATESLLTAEVSIDIFYHVWSIIRYLLSFFYIFMFIYSGYIFLTSNANPIRRAQAKEMIANTLMMIMLIQGSFFIYGLVLKINAVMSQAMLSIIDPHFFMFTLDNIVNIGLEFSFMFLYAVTLLTTVLMLCLRYIMACFGVILFPIGIFCYYIPSLKGYGKFIIHLIGWSIFITFFDLLIILGCSLLVQVALFEYFKIIVMICCFMMVNYTILLVIKFALSKSTGSDLKDDFNQAIKYIALLA